MSFSSIFYSIYHIPPIPSLLSPSPPPPLSLFRQLFVLCLLPALLWLFFSPSSDPTSRAGKCVCMCMCVCVCVCVRMFVYVCASVVCLCVDVYYMCMLYKMLCKMFAFSHPSLPYPSPLLNSIRSNPLMDL